MLSLTELISKIPPEHDMHDPEKFQQETVKAILDLQNTFAQTQSRQLALGALLTAFVRRVPLEALAGLLEEYEAEVDHQAAQLPPEHQRRKYWDEISKLISARMRYLQQRQDQGKPSGR